MKLSGKALLQIDRLFLPVHRVIDVLPFFFSRRTGNECHPVLVIKFMGMGSIVRWISLCEDHEVDKEKIILVTFDRHRELCKLFGFAVWLIRTESIGKFMTDCWSIIRQVGKLRPSVIVDYERCSHSVSVFRKILTWQGNSRSVSFDIGGNHVTGREIVYPADELTLKDLLMKGIDVLAKKKSDASPTTSVAVQSNKILVNVNVSDYLLARRYPAELFADVVQTLHQRNPEVEFYFTGSASESQYVDAILNKLSNVSTYNVCGQWNLEKLLIELADAAVFITGDSGPMHLAAYLKIPVIALWGPTQPDHFGYESQKDLHHITLNLTCSPCFRHPASHPAVYCKGQITCLTNMLPLTIVEKIRVVINGLPPTRLVNFPAGIRSIGLPIPSTA